MNVTPNIFTYGDYRQYLLDMYTHLKGHPTKPISYRMLSRAAGFVSPSALKMVISGQRNISLEKVEKLALLFSLNKSERRFFVNLVLLNQAKSYEEKNIFSREILRTRQYKKFHPGGVAETKFYEKWYHAAIRELIDLPHFQNEHQWIAEQLRPRITAAEAKSAIDTLLELGLIQKKKEKLSLSDKILETNNIVTNIAVSRFQRTMIHMALDALEKVEKPKRKASSVTLGVSVTTYEMLVKKIDQFREELMSIAENEKNPEVVYQINFQLFPLSHEPSPTPESDKK